MTTKKVVKVVGICLLVLVVDYFAAIWAGKAIDADDAFQDTIVQPYRQRVKQLEHRNAEEDAVQQELEKERRQFLPQIAPPQKIMPQPTRRPQVDIARIH